jgi:soluble P-type ATPase
LTKTHDKFELRKIELKNLHNNFEMLDKEEIIFNLKARRKKSIEEELT